VGALLSSSGPGIYSNYTSVDLGGYYESSAWIGPKCKIRQLASSEVNIQHSDVPSVVTTLHPAYIDLLALGCSGPHQLVG